MRHAQLLVTLIALMLAGPALAADPSGIGIDDLTWIEDGRIIHLQAPPAETPSQERQVVTGVKAAGARGLGDGYAACSTSHDVYPVDLGTHTAGTAIVLPGASNYPYDATMRPDGTEVWIADATDDSVMVLDMATDTIPHQVTVGDYPVSVAFSQDQTFAVVVCRDNSAGVDNIFRVSTSTYAVLDSWVGPLDYLGPGNIALDPVSGNFYMVQWYDTDLHELAADGSSVLRTAVLGTSLWQLVVDPDGSVLYVTDRGTDQVRVINRTTLTQTSAVAVGDDPWGIDITPDGAKLYVSCEDSHDVWAVDTTTWAATSISLGAGDPRDVDVSPDGSEVYVAGGDSGSPDYVYVIDVATDTLSFSIPLTGASNVNVVAAANQPVPVELSSFQVD